MGMTTCIMAGCRGELDKKNAVMIKTGCFSYDTASPCGKCGRLHSDEGGTFFNRQGNPVYTGKGLVEEQHLMVWQFNNATAQKRRDRKKATILCEVATPKDLRNIKGDHLLCSDPRTQKWLTVENGIALLSSA